MTAARKQPMIDLTDLPIDTFLGLQAIGQAGIPALAVTRFMSRESFEVLILLGEQATSHEKNFPRGKRSTLNLLNLLADKAAMKV